MIYKRIPQCKREPLLRMSQTRRTPSRALCLLDEGEPHGERQVANDKPSSIIEITIPDYQCKFVFKVHPDTVVRDLFRQLLTACRLDQQRHMNFGLFMPSTCLQKGKFLQEERLLSEYPQLLTHSENSYSGDQPEGGAVARLNLIPKTRFVDGYPMGKDKFKRANTQWQQRLFIDAVQGQNVSRVCAMLEQGIDPNFQCRRSGLIPLSRSAEHTHPREMILKLVEKGAHLEYRDAKSLTALHHAALIGNEQAIQVLLDLGMSPNVRDFRGLTPLYYAASCDIPSKCISTLLFNHAILGVTDEKDRQEIHQACLFGRSEHLLPMIRYGADLNAQAQNLDTPLHVCVLNDQEKCLRLLLRYGALQDISNASGQTPYEVAVLTGRTVLASVLEGFSPSDVEVITEKPVYNRDRRPTIIGPRGAFEGLLKVGDVEFGPGHNLSHGPGDLTPNNHSNESFNSVDGGNPVPWATMRPDSSGSQPGGAQGRIRVVTMTRQSNGFGFKIIGSMNPSPSTLNEDRPATQFVFEVISGTPADFVRLRPGDFILEVDGVDVSAASHRDVSNLISRSGPTVTLKILTSFPFTTSRDAQETQTGRQSTLQVTDRRRSQSQMPTSIDRKYINGNITGTINTIIPLPAPRKTSWSIAGGPPVPSFSAESSYLSPPASLNSLDRSPETVILIRTNQLPSSENQSDSQGSINALMERNLLRTRRRFANSPLPPGAEYLVNTSRTADIGDG